MNRMLLICFLLLSFHKTYAIDVYIGKDGCDESERVVSFSNNHSYHSDKGAKVTLPDLSSTALALKDETMLEQLRVAFGLEKWIESQELRDQDLKPASQRPVHKSQNYPVQYELLAELYESLLESTEASDNRLFKNEVDRNTMRYFLSVRLLSMYNELPPFTPVLTTANKRKHQKVMESSSKAKRGSLRALLCCLPQDQVFEFVKTEPKQDKRSNADKSCALEEFRDQEYVRSSPEEMRLGDTSARPDNSRLKRSRKVTFN